MLKQGVFQVGLLRDQNKSSYTHAEISRTSPGLHLVQYMEHTASAGECCAFSTVFFKKVWQVGWKVGTILGHCCMQSSSYLGASHIRSGKGHLRSKWVLTPL